MPMPNRVKVFPRGYSGGQSTRPDRHKTRSGDAEINALWEQYNQPVNQSTAWSFRKKVIQAAKRLLGGNTNWFLSQDHNPMLFEYNYQFVIDTLRFIATGSRRISIHAWPDLVTNYPEGQVADVSERHDVADMFESAALTTSTDVLIQLWCSRTGGFDDMICTLYILFGDIPLKIENR